MIDPELLAILCCPETKQDLKLADAILIKRLNEAIAGGTIKNRDGVPVVEMVDGGLVRDDHQFLYPIREEIPVMLVGEGIPLSLLSEI
ncbi:MAG: hypothetical protein SGI71_06825 [Verrucomicrobiota bacterium]|nr:hypothetical protein [Verrucomicrobiota bacterium]